MEEENVENKGFKISDRRLSVRGYEDEEEAAAQPPAPPREDERAGFGAPAPAPPEAREPAPAPPQRPEPEPAGEPEDAEEAEEDKSFDMLVAIMQTNALAAMGIHPQTGERIGAADPRSSKMFVDLFTALKEKTRGNLSAEEEQLLNQVHSDLQMVYVREVGFG